MDVELGPHYDLLTEVGFMNAVFQVCNLRPGSGHLTAPVCSTFVWMQLGDVLWYQPWIYFVSTIVDMMF